MESFFTVEVPLAAVAEKDKTIFHELSALSRSAFISKAQGAES
jgi:hypothetical protein